MVHRRFGKEIFWLSWIGGVLLAAGSWLAAAEKAEADLAAFLPDDALAALIIPDLAAARAQFAKTKQGEMFSQPAVREFFQSARAEIKKQYLAVREKQTWLPTPENLDQVLLTGGLAVALVPPKDPGEKQIRVVGIFVPKDPAAFLKLLPKDLAAKLKPKPAPEDTVAWVNEHFVCCNSAPETQKVVAKLQTSAVQSGSLAESAACKSARAHLVNSSFSLYLQPAKALVALFNYIKKVSPENANALPKWQALSSALGLTKLESLALGVGTREGEVVLESWSGFNMPPHDDLFALCFPPADASFDLAAFKIAPPDAPFLKATYFNLAGILPLIQRGLQAFDSKMAQEFNAKLQQFNQNTLQFDLQKDLLENIGSEILVVQPSLDTGLTGLPNVVCSFQLKDAAKVEECLNKIAAALDNLPDPAKGRIKLKKFAYRGRNICYVSAPIFQVTPAVCVAGERLLGCISLTGLRQALDQMSKPANILGDKVFQEAVAKATGMPFDAQKQPAVIAFSRALGNGAGALLEAGAYLAAAEGVTAGLAYCPPPTGIAPDSEAAKKAFLAMLGETDLALWPDEGFFRPYSRPTVAVGLFEKNGLYVRTGLPMPMPAMPKTEFASLSSVAIVAVVAGVTLPIIARAREAARQARLKQSGDAQKNEGGF